MNIIAYETSTSAFSVSLLKEEMVWHDQELSPQQHAHVILSYTSKLLEQAALNICNIDAIAYSCGPGSFTGIRIGAAVGQAMALANQIPLIAIPSMEVAVWGIYRQFSFQKVMVVLDARMEQVYCGYYVLEPKSGMITPQPGRLCSLYKIDWTPVNRDWILITDLNEKMKAAIPTIFRALFNYFPHAVDLLPLAQRKMQEGERPTFEQSLPIYFHPEQAWAK
jgi:tRNA threonylcarbamoyladenosine biosynthesis protein TsaB